MERLLAFYHRKFDHYTLDEYLIIGFVCSLFLPFYIPMVVIVGILCYLTIKKRWKQLLQETPSTKLGMAFSLLTTLVSFYYHNINGVLCGIGLFLIFLFFAFYRSVITKRLFELLMDASCILSLFCFAYAIMEYFHIIEILNFEFIDLIVVDDPAYRVNSTFFNANYYAMMIEFIIFICVYKMMQMKTKRRIVFYVVTIVCNAFALYLTGCRTAWPTFALSVPLMFFMNRKYGYFGCSVGGMLTCAGAVLLNPDLLPRSGAGDSFGTRMEIWKGGLRALKDHPIFGQGPMTYFHTYAQYDAPLAHHCHSVYLDPLVSFGIVGAIMLYVYLGAQLKKIYILWKRKIDVRLCSLILAFIGAVAIHGILDYTIFWVQTGILFMIVYYASEMYFHKD